MCKFIIKYFLLVAVFLVGCDSKQDWDFKETIDKISGEKIIVVSKRFKDKDVPGIIIDFAIKCQNQDVLFGEIKSFKETSGETLPSVAFKGLTNGNKAVAIETRSGKNKIIYPLIAEEFNNVGVFPIPKTLNQDFFNGFLTQMAGLYSSLTLAMQDDKAWIETSQLLSGEEWHIQIPTLNGNPVITVNLNDGNIKKIFAKCNWKPGVLPNTLQPATSSVADPVVSPTPAPTPAPAPAPAPAPTPVTAADNSPFTPSFDCSKASNVQEKMVCSDRDLAKLDVQLAQSYAKVREKSPDKESLKKEQLNWIKLNLRACSDKPCLIESYNKRISELKGL